MASSSAEPSALAAAQGHDSERQQLCDLHFSPAAARRGRSRGMLIRSDEGYSTEEERKCGFWACISREGSRTSRVIRAWHPSMHEAADAEHEWDIRRPEVETSGASSSSGGPAVAMRLEWHYVWNNQILRPTDPLVEAWRAAGHKLIMIWCREPVELPTDTPGPPAPAVPEEDYPSTGGRRRQLRTTMTSVVPSCIGCTRLVSIQNLQETAALTLLKSLTPPQRTLDKSIRRVRNE